MQALACHGEHAPRCARQLLGVRSRGPGLTSPAGRAVRAFFRRLGSSRAAPYPSSPGPGQAGLRLTAVQKGYRRPGGPRFSRFSCQPIDGVAHAPFQNIPTTQPRPRPHPHKSRHCRESPASRAAEAWLQDARAVRARPNRSLCPSPRRASAMLRGPRSAAAASQNRAAPTGFQLQPTASTPLSR